MVFEIATYFLPTGMSSFCFPLVSLTLLKRRPSWPLASKEKQRLAHALNERRRDRDRLMKQLKTVKELSRPAQPPPAL